MCISVRHYNSRNWLIFRPDLVHALCEERHYSLITPTFFCPREVLLAPGSLPSVRVGSSRRGRAGWGSCAPTNSLSVPACWTISDWVDRVATILVINPLWDRGSQLVGAAERWQLLSFGADDIDALLISMDQTHNDPPRYIESLMS